jgi:hypothetical protein
VRTVWIRTKPCITTCGRNERIYEQIFIQIYIYVSLLKLKLSYNRWSVGQSVLLSGSPLEPMTRFLFSVWHLWVSWYNERMDL